MTKFEIAKHIADNHNRLAGILASGGMKLMDADSVILMGDTLRDLRALAQRIMEDAKAEDAEAAKENSTEK